MQPPADPTIAEIAPWMETVVPSDRLLTADDVLALNDTTWHFELVKGRLVRMSPTGWRHGKIVVGISQRLSNHVAAQDLGVVVGAETGFLVQRAPDTVLAPDAAFVRRERLPGDEAAEDGFLALAPDLAVEVASPSQYHPEMNAKALAWLAAGTPLVWIVWPKTRQIDVWQAGDAQPGATLGPDDTLDGGAVVPGFVVRVGELF